ncbi:metallophosphoesterase [Oceanobacillus piezotolerans]|uniref:Metallophosphoesterase n=1 Tax=Oceanobacillus piezotolerans TaxID=2448030 RepID=A0A498D5Z3_9BACI|nr:metallophosphoesterase family protein [Oceanobacillus piezotolerans]RLL40110.1 metallophosphoesterase [Oceanobacillus piezotolerans]
MGTSIAIIADIHGNSAALKAVLDDIDKDEQVEHIYCLGDLIGIGHQTNEVLELLFSRHDITFVKGNHDEAVLKIINGKEPVSVGDERKHHNWIASRLNEKYIPKLLSIPNRQFRNINGKNFLFIHYHLNEKDEFMPIDNQPTIGKLDAIYENSDADVICFGHHHIVHHFKSKQRLYLNPSSVGCSHKPLTSYVKLHVGENEQIDTSFIEVPYDNKEFLLSYEKLNVPDRNNILRIFYGEQHLQYI